MIKILNAEPLNYSEQAHQILQGIGDVTSIQLDQAGLLSRIGEFDVLIIRLAHKIDRSILDAGTHLQAIVTATTGVDHIDVEYAEKKQIEILSLRGEFDFLRTIPATAEHTWALLLSLIRNIPQALASTISGHWDRDQFKGHDLAGRRLGIVGLGRIGGKIAKYGLAFGMQVFAFDPYRLDWIDQVERCNTLDNLLSVSDVLSLHVPLNEITYHMISYRELRLLPKHAILVNTARGSVLDGEALVQCLSEGYLSGAALDVIEGELDKTQLSTNPLLAYARTKSNLLITPHIGGATFESMAATEIFMAKKLRAWAQESKSAVKDTGIDFTQGVT